MAALRRQTVCGSDPPLGLSFMSTGTRLTTTEVRFFFVLSMHVGVEAINTSQPDHSHGHMEATILADARLDWQWRAGSEGDSRRTWFARLKAMSIAQLQEGEAHVRSMVRKDTGKRLALQRSHPCYGASHALGHVNSHSSLPTGCLASSISSLIRKDRKATFERCK